MNVNSCRGEKENPTQTHHFQLVERRCYNNEWYLYAVFVVLA